VKTNAMPVPDSDCERMEGAAFWKVRTDLGATALPVDTHAVYGSVVLSGNRPPPGVPHRRGHSNVVTAIRTVRPGDRVRVNDGGWMEALGKDDEGFVARYDNGDVRYTVQPANGLNRPVGTFHSPWMRRADDYSSEGEVYSLEVEWDADADRGV